MRWRVLAFISLGVNIVLAAVWLSAPRRSRALQGEATAGVAQATAGQSKGNVQLRRQFFSWRDLESDDYAAFIANLRDIDCPEQTIRDIIIADVNALYARKRATELVTAEQQWWRSEPDTNVVQAATEKTRALEEERRALLARLLGTGWESGDMANLPRPSRPGVLLDGPVLGELAVETKQAIQAVSSVSEDRMQAYLEAQRREGKTPDPLELARLRQQTRDELARLLSPSQLEEFLLRYSQNANDLRATFGQLRFFNATPDEFRAIFRATDALDQQMQLLVTANDPNGQARKALEDQRENALKTALGAKRYEEYRMLQDPVYRDAVAQAQAAGTPEAAGLIYEINLAAASVQDSIRANTNLTAEQKGIELKRLELQQLQANTAATGQDLPPEPPAPQPQTPKKVHVVTPGDTIATVSLQYGVTISAIREANPNLDLTKLRPGDSLLVPATGLTPSVFR